MCEFVLCVISAHACPKMCMEDRGQLGVNPLYHLSHLPSQRK